MRENFAFNFKKESRTPRALERKEGEEGEGEGFLSKRGKERECAHSVAKKKKSVFSRKK